MTGPLGFPKLGALAALGSSALWAYGSTRYAGESRVVGSPAVNLIRAIIVLPLFATFAFLATGSLWSAIGAREAAWLLLSVVCSYAFADSVFFAAARSIGVSTALAIASSYPLWSTFVGVILGGERFGPLRAAGTIFCIGGVITLIRLAPHANHDGPRKPAATRGVLFAIATSVLWAGNTISVREGAASLDPWHANLVRYTFALPLIAVSHRLWPGPKPIAGSGAVRRLLLPSVLEAFLGSSLFVFALAHTDLSIGATLSSMAPLLSVPMAIAMGEERWSPARFLAVAATVVGVVLLVIGA